MSSKYDSFRAVLTADKEADNRLAIKFIYEGNLATTISYNSASISAAIAYKNNDELERAYVYVVKPQLLTIGGIFVWNDSHYLVINKEKIVKEVLYNKYSALECNFSFEGIWGYFKGSITKYINTQIKDDTIITSDAKPVAIMPRNSWTVGDVITINGRPWLIIERDDCSIEGLSYYSLEASYQDKIVENLEVVDNGKIKVHALDIITITTEEGYFICNKNISVKKTLNTVQFTVPFGIDTFDIEFKVLGVVQKSEYEVIA